MKFGLSPLVFPTPLSSNNIDEHTYNKESIRALPQFIALAHITFSIETLDGLKDRFHAFIRIRNVPKILPV